MGKLGAPTGLHRAEVAASYVRDSLLTLDGIDDVLIAGSVRRQRPVVSDVDLVVVTDGVIDLTQYRGSLDDHRIAFTPKGGVALIEGVRVELYLAPPGCAGATLQFVSGPGSLNVWLRSLAKNKGWKLSQYGLYDGHGKDAVRLDRSTGDPYADEMSIFEALGVDYIAPEDRDEWRDRKRYRREGE